MRQAFRLLALIACVAGMANVSMAEEGDAPWSMADAYFDPAEMQASREHLQHSHGAMRSTYFQAERFEWQHFDDEDVIVLDANAWIGGDINKLWFKSELEYLPEEGEFEEAELQVLWSRAISPYFDFQAGVRQDFEPDGLTHLVAGFQGLAPYLFELDAASFLSADGDLTARVEAEYELLLTQRLILQPRAEISFSAQDIPELGTGAGISSLNAGLRLRYEIEREFAPYIGVEWQERFGKTADFVEAAGGDAGEAVFLFGIRAWY